MSYVYNPRWKKCVHLHLLDKKSNKGFGGFFPNAKSALSYFKKTKFKEAHLLNSWSGQSHGFFKKEKGIIKKM